MKQFHEDLINQAIQAAKAGDRDSAYELVKDIVEEDPLNIRAWLLLARFTRDAQERMMAVTSVLNLDPNNEQALKMKAQAEVLLSKQQSSDIIPGISRRQLQIISVIVVGVVLLLAAVVFVTISNNQQEAAALAREETRLAVQSTGFKLTETQAAIVLTQDAINATATQIARVSPTPTLTFTSSAPTLPPTPTDTPTATATATVAPVPDLPGRILAWGGQDLANRDALPLRFYAVSANSQPLQINAPDGRYPVMSQDGTKIAYGRYVVRELDFAVSLVDPSGAALGTVLDTAPIVGGYEASDMPSLSADGSRISLIGKSEATRSDSVYLVVLNGTPIDGLIVLQLTNDSANYSFPSMSPDGSQVVVVRTANGTTDLVIIDVRTRSQRPLTTDGNAVVETTPRWAQNGNIIAFAGYTEDRRNNDLYLIGPDNPGAALSIITSPADDKHPVFSPDGRYLAFASNRTQSYDIYILNLASRDLFQMTNSEREEIYPGFWIDG